ncbi:uncharacterized protein LOC113848477 [Abrus precatorius]|uniref:Uncharacterized protein LOC113848477 n=1 Tax=Abrus precatorius TaxID=3816 RepID=A0A8B8JQR4_ABRPR|nr:uncharacterized protein LOC113848477 [Abrus precatorius]
MGACFSYNSSYTFKNVCVVHYNGSVEDFEQPISASQVIAPKHFLSSSTMLLSSSSESLNGDTHLQPGQAHFMLPCSMLQADVSPVDLASLPKRLTSRRAGRVGMVEQFGMSMMNGGGSPCRVQPWKPIFDSIKERPLKRRSESDKNVGVWRVLDGGN